MDKCTLCGSEDRIDDRGKYPVCYGCATEQLECKERQREGVVLDRDASPLCMQCGLCCIVLSAEAKPSEVEHLANWSGKLPRDISMIEQFPYAGAGRIVLKRPCVFLMGKPTEYVSCRAYQTKRPEVCETYLCKLAVRYKAGTCTLKEAMFILRASVTSSGDLGMFNWSSSCGHRDDDDRNLSELIAAKKALSLLDPDDDRVLDIGYVLYERLRRRYKFISDHHEVLLSAMFDNFDSKSIELDHYFSPRQMAGWCDRDKEIAEKTIYQVVDSFRDIFEVDKSPRQKS